MSKGIKIILIIAGIFVAGLLIAVFNIATKTGFGVVIFGIAYIAFARAIWNYEKDDEDNTNETHILKKD